MQKDAFKNFTKFKGKHLCQRLVFNKVVKPEATLLKKETKAQVFFCESCEVFKNAFFTEHFRMTTSKLEWL